MKNWTIGKRIIAVCLVLIALLLAISSTAYFNLRTIRAQSQQIRDDNVPGLVYSGLINSTLEDSFIRTLLAGMSKTPEEREKFIKEQEALSAKTADALTKYEAAIFTAEDRTIFDALKLKRQHYGEDRARYYAALRAGKADDARAVLDDALTPIYTEFTKSGDDLMEYNNTQSVDHANGIVTNAENVNRIIVTAALLALGLGTVLAYIVIRSVNKVLHEISNTLGSSADQVSAASGQVSSASQTLASGASEQAASLEETSASLEEISSMTKRNSENATKANEVTRKTRSTADQGAKDMESMARAMQEIKASSDDIAKIIRTIDEIAFQTNILALNAAVEAARAGEAGAGFAVVADEVRNLAQRAAQSAKETAAKIEGAITKTAQGVEISANVQKSLQQIVEQVRTVDELVSEVAQASNEQTQGIAQVGTSVRQMDQVTQGNAANAEETASASEELSAQAESLKDVVGQLLRLVSGQGATNSTTPVPVPATRKTVSPRNRIKMPVVTAKNGHSSHQLEPVAAGVEDEFFR